MSIKQPRWKTPEYSITQIDKAGVSYHNPNSTNAEREHALLVIDNWRAAHAYPLHVFFMNLRIKSSHRDDVLVVERLKRLDSITAKLKRQGNMKLSRMQD